MENEGIHINKKILASQITSSPHLVDSSFYFEKYETLIRKCFENIQAMRNVLLNLSKIIIGLSDYLRPITIVSRQCENYYLQEQG